MMRYPVLALAAAAGLSPSSRLGAQATPIAAEITPYAGYMVSSALVDGPLGSSIASAGRPLYGLQLGVPLTRTITLVGNVARAQGDLEVGLPLIGGIPVGESEAWLLDAGVQLGLPLGLGRAQAIVPFIQLGAGAMRQSLDIAPVAVRATNLALNAGAGADLALSSSIGVRLMVKDYIGRFDFEEATSFDLDRGSAHNIALSAGVRLAF